MHLPGASPGERMQPSRLLVASMLAATAVTDQQLPLLPVGMNAILLPGEQCRLGLGGMTASNEGGEGGGNSIVVGNN